MVGAQSAATNAHVIHLALVVAVAMFGAVLLAVGARPPVGRPAVLLAVLVAVAVSEIGIALWLKHRIPDRASATSDDLWWAANLKRAIPVWALLESAALVGVIFHFLGVGRAGLIVAAGALALLVANGPGRLIDR